MAKINLIIADTDSEYLEEISKFLACKAFLKFQISSFSTGKKLSEYIENNSNKIDILLINPEMYNDSLMQEIKGIMIFFIAGEVPDKANSINYINKYQKADDILNEIISIYFENSNDLSLSGVSSHKTKIVAVYSASGGVGKSLIAAVSAVFSVKEGLNTLYLNLENFQSTFRYFNKNSEKSFSNLIYYLKDRKNRLSKKIEEIKCVDEKSGVHFFAPPESSIEIENMNTEDIKYMFGEIKETGLYDTVFIDMAVDFNERNIEVMEEADFVYFVINNDETSDIKKKEFIRQIEILREKKDILICEKICFIENKRNPATDDNYLNGETKEEIVSIPYNANISKCKSVVDIFETNEEFDYAITQLNKRIF